MISPTSIKQEHSTSEALRLAVGWLRSLQCEDGTWSATHQPDIRSTSEYILTNAWFGQHASDDVRQSNAWLHTHLAAGPDGLDISELVLTRLALHWLQHTPSSKMLSSLLNELDERIDRNRTLQSVERSVHVYLAVLNQLPYAACNLLPAEFVLLPEWAPLALATHRRWDRLQNVTLGLIDATAPRRTDLRPLSQLNRIRTHPGRSRPGSNTGQTRGDWASLASLKFARRLVPRLRKQAIRKSQKWIINRLSPESGVGGSLSTTMLAAIALSATGYERTSPAIQRCFDAIQRHRSDDGGVSRCSQPNLDTALALRALSNTPGLRALDIDKHNHKAVETLLVREVARRGDGSDRIDAPAGGWSLEACNELYPDIGCTAQTLLAMRAHVAYRSAESLVSDDSMAEMIKANSGVAAQRIAVADRVAAASRRARHWLIAMQNRDGSWGSEADSELGVASRTGLVLQALGEWETKTGQQSVDSATRFLVAGQRSDGLWAGNETSEVVATSHVVSGLMAVGMPVENGSLQRGLAALAAKQNSDGGFASQIGQASDIHATSRAATTLIEAHQKSMGAGRSAQSKSQAAHRKTRHRIRRAIEWLLEQQAGDGRWSGSSQSTEPSTSDFRATVMAIDAISRYASL